eukprot:scaffold37223_cov326-Isochrysis_galbana.AAC.3
MRRLLMLQLHQLARVHPPMGGSEHNRPLQVLRVESMSVRDAASSAGTSRGLGGHSVSRLHQPSTARPPPGIVPPGSELCLSFCSSALHTVQHNFTTSRASQRHAASD